MKNDETSRKDAGSAIGLAVVAALVASPTNAAEWSCAPEGVVSSVSSAGEGRIKIEGVGTLPSTAHAFASDVVDGDVRIRAIPQERLGLAVLRERAWNVTVADPTGDRIGIVIEDAKGITRVECLRNKHP
jgi:hypothetical protein